MAPRAEDSTDFTSMMRTQFSQAVMLICYAMASRYVLRTRTIRNTGTFEPEAKSIASEIYSKVTTPMIGKEVEMTLVGAKFMHAVATWVKDYLAEEAAQEVQ